MSKQKSEPRTLANVSIGPSIPEMTDEQLKAILAATEEYVGIRRTPNGLYEAIRLTINPDGTSMKHLEPPQTVDWAVQDMKMLIQDMIFMLNNPPSVRKE